MSAKDGAGVLLFLGLVVLLLSPIWLVLLLGFLAPVGLALLLPLSIFFWVRSIITRR